MIIIPTEKRFDWRHPPFVLFSIVLVNMFVYFIYQANDDAKYKKAVELYEKSDLTRIELPLLKTYLKNQGEHNALAQLNQLNIPRDQHQFTNTVISRLDFYRHLNRYYEKFFSPDEYQTWRSQRQAVNTFISSISTHRLGLTPSSTTVYAFISYQFLHGDLFHLAGNMLFLVICGFAVEAALGHRMFLAFYLLAGVIGALLHFIFNHKSPLPLVGASASISGVMAMYVTMFKLKKIEFFYWIFVFVGYFRAPALIVLAFFVVQELVNAIVNTGSNIAFLAHLGGFAAGAALIKIVLQYRPDLFNQTYVEEKQDIDPRREQHAKVYDLVEHFQFDHALRHLDKLIEADGLNFEFAMLRYNLTKVDKGIANIHKSAAATLLRLKNLSTDQAESLSKVWTNDLALQHLADKKSLLRLGLSFCELKNPILAENIFKRLLKDNKTDGDLAVLARRLSNCFERVNDAAKKQYYQDIAQTLFKG